MSTEIILGGKWDCWSIQMGKSNWKWQATLHHRLRMLHRRPVFHKMPLIDYLTKQMKPRWLLGCIWRLQRGIFVLLKEKEEIRNRAKRKRMCKEVLTRWSRQDYPLNMFPLSEPFISVSSQSFYQRSSSFVCLLLSTDVCLLAFGQQRVTQICVVCLLT